MATPRDEATATTVEDIVVTAQRRAQKLQDVPIAVNAITSSALAARGLNSAADLAGAIPGLTFASQGAAGTPFLRGVGAGSGNPSDEQSVATYVDGVYIAAPFGNVFSFNNIDRIEVLKGPQGTLFGRNATGGVVQVITRDPTMDQTAEGKIGYGNYQTLAGSLYVNTPISEQVAANFAGQFEKQGKGWGRSVTQGTETYKRRDMSVRGKVLIEPNDATRIVLSADYMRSRSTGLDYQLPQGVAGIDGVPFNLGRYDTRSNFRNAMPKAQWGVSARIEQDLGFADLVSITAYRKAKVDYIVDADATPVAGTNAELFQRQHNVSQEVHLVSQPGSKVDWLLGAFYYKTKAGQVARISGASAGGLPYLDIIGFMRTRSISGFGQASVEVLPDTKLTGGLRYTTERQSLIASIDSPIGVLLPEITPHPKQTTNRATWRIAIDHRFTPDVLAYASYNRGTKSGGFDILSFNAFRPEQLDAYEVGLKTELLGRRLRFNISAFWYDYKDIQVQIVNTVGAQTLNAAAARIKGIDIDFEAVPVAGLTLSGGLAYTDGKYTNYADAVAYPASPGPSVVFDASGNRTVRTPKLSANLNADYRVPLGSGGLTFSASMNYTSRYYWASDNRLDQPATTLFNGSITWAAEDDRFSVRAWGRNLTDKRYYAQAVASGNGDIVVQAAPRTYGLTLGFKY